MTRKKSRTETRIGIPKTNAPRVHKTLERPKAKSGNKSGSRQQLAEAILASAKHKNVDPRAGSKKPVDLSKYTKEQSSDSAEHGKISTVETIKYKTPQAEFDAIEADEKLEALLEKREEGKLSAAENAYVNKMTARYKILCDLMGIDVDDYANNTPNETNLDDDPFAALDAIKMDDFKD